MKTKDRLLECFLNLGVRIESQEDVDLREFFKDSIQFISAVLEIEKTFSIVFPDELLMYDVFNSLNNLTEIIDLLLDEKTVI